MSYPDIPAGLASISANSQLAKGQRVVIHTRGAVIRGVVSNGTRPPAVELNDGEIMVDRSTITSMFVAVELWVEGSEDPKLSGKSARALRRFGRR